MSSIQGNKVYAHLEFCAKRESSSVMQICINVAPYLVNKIKKYTVETYRNKISTKGFADGTIPDSFIEKNYSKSIIESTLKFILKFFVTDYLEEQILQHQFVCLSASNLHNVEVLSDNSVNYVFKNAIINPIMTTNWEKISFHPPRRKLYKDLDRQASIFIKNSEDEELKKVSDQVEDGDWVCFSATLLNSNNQPAIRDFKNQFWLKIDTKYIATPLHQSFLEKKEGEIFFVEELLVFGMPSDLLSVKGKFKISIVSIVKSNKFSLQRFKSVFSLPDTKAAHEKLIEIFSFRNDISQRRLIIEEAFRVLFNKFRFEVPRYLVLRKQERLLESIRKSPDYNVYKTSGKLEKQVSVLAEKQIKEEALIKQIGFNEGIKVEHSDILDYLNLLSHPRLVEFIYFMPNMENFNDICLPIKNSVFNMSIFKEKVLNFIIRKMSPQ